MPKSTRPTVALPSDSSEQGFGGAAKVLAALVTIIPSVVVWDYGGVLAWSAYWVSLAVAVVGLISLAMLYKRVSPVRPIQCVAPLLAMAMVAGGLLQSLDQSSRVAQWISPGVHLAYTRFIPEPIADEFEGVANDRDRWLSDRVADRHYPSTVSRSNTFAAMTMPILAAAVFMISVLTIRDQRTIVLVLCTIAFSGTCVAVLGLLDVVRYSPPNQDGNFVTPEFFGSAPFGPFINKNNAGGYLNLTLSATVGLLAWSLRRAGKEVRIDPQYEIAPETTWERFTSFLAGLLSRLNANSTTLLAVAVIQTVAIAASQSRGAIVATAAAAVVVAMHARRDRHLVHWAVVIVGIGVLIVARWMLVYLNLDQTVGDRVESIFTLSEGSQVGRLQHLADAAGAAWAYFPGGAGMGTYRYAILPYQESTDSSSLFLNADCMPMEWLVEGGIWLPLILIAGVAIVVEVLFRLPNQRRSYFSGLLAMGWFLLVSQLVACCFDFGILLPANYLTAGILLGVLFASVPLRSSEASARIRQANDPLPKSGDDERRWVRVVSRLAMPVTLILIATGVGGVIEINRRLAQTGFQRTRMVRAISNGTSSSSGQPSSLTASWIGDQMSLDPERDFIASLALLEGQERFGPADPLDLTLRRDGQLPGKTVRQIQNDPRIAVRRMISFVDPIDVADKASTDQTRIRLVDGQDLQVLRQARFLAMSTLLRCPLHPFVRLPLIKTDFVRTGERPETSPASTPSAPLALAAIADADLTKQLADDAFDLQPNNADLIESLARLAYVFPGGQVADPLLTRLLQLHPNRFDSLWPMISSTVDPDASELDRVPRVLAIVPDDLRSALQVADSKLVGKSIRLRMLDRAERWIGELRTQATGDELQLADLAYATARVAIGRNDATAAIESMQEAVRLSPGEALYRGQLIDLLIQAEQYDLAIENLQRAIIQNPRDERLQQRLREIRNLSYRTTNS